MGGCIPEQAKEPIVYATEEPRHGGGGVGVGVGGWWWWLLWSGSKTQRWLRREAVSIGDVGSVWFGWGRGGRG